MDLVRRQIKMLLEKYDETIVFKNPKKIMYWCTGSEPTRTLNCKENNLIRMENYLSDRIQNGEIESNPPCLCRIEGSICMRTGYTCDDYEVIFCPLSIES